MPKTGIRQKSGRRLKTCSPFENTHVSNGDEEDEGMDMDRADEDEEDIPEKDEAEQKLEKLLFGDDEGFHSALKEHQEREIGRVSGESDEGEEAAEEEETGERDLGAVPDADVSIGW